MTGSAIRIRRLFEMVVSMNLARREQGTDLSPNGAPAAAAAVPVVEVSRVGMCFRLHYEKAHTLKETVVRFVRRRNSYRDLWALKDVSLSIRPGEAVAIIGRNGSGKSTLLKVIAGVFAPTEGTCAVKGAVSALIELGAGFNGELTGRENVYLNGAIMGLSKAEMDERYDRIVAFAELGDFMDMAVKNYSSGMYARLGFSIATEVNGDILLMDEILAVGDEAFQRKCLERIDRELSSGKTLVYVSHDANSVARICRRAVLLHGGQVVSDGAVAPTLAEYRKLSGVA
jgi:ABC-type polysaccharide/polyol phosphate transport system ATPase subunit